jgi:hypothetical protein
MARSKVFSILACVVFAGCSSSGSDRPAAVDGALPDSSADASTVPRGGKPDASVRRSRDAAPDAVVKKPDAAVVPSTNYPPLLSQTGLFTDMKAETLGQGVRAFQPRYVLWTDGAKKRRWLYLPVGQQIDTSDMDSWIYPVGTKVWKEFTRGTTRVETRMLNKTGPKKSDWVMIAYQWQADQTDAKAVPDGVIDASGTTHDIPAQDKCMSCHGNMRDTLLGVTAIQLSHGQPGVTITDLITEKRLTNPPAAPFQLPGDARAQDALGYLHANCGHCHNPGSVVSVSHSLDLWESTQSLDTVEHTVGYMTTVLQNNAAIPDLHIIEPGRPDLSELYYRISRRDSMQMPPIGTELVDPDGMAKVKAWIESLPAVDAGAVARPRDAGIRDAATGG